MLETRCNIRKMIIIYTVGHKYIFHWHVLQTAIRSTWLIHVNLFISSVFMFWLNTSRTNYRKNTHTHTPNTHSLTHTHTLTFTHKHHMCIYIYTYRCADNSLARPGRKQSTVSAIIMWISFVALPCRINLDVTSRLHVGEIVLPWHASELNSFLFGLRTYQYTDISLIIACLFAHQ